MRESNSSYPWLLSEKKDEWVSEGFCSALNFVLRKSVVQELEMENHIIVKTEATKLERKIMISSTSGSLSKSSFPTDRLESKGNAILRCVRQTPGMLRSGIYAHPTGDIRQSRR